MKIFTCIKYVPDTSEAEVKLNAEGTAVDSSRFSFDINDADNYAVEESVLIKEKNEGSVTVVSIGPKQSDVMIRMAMAKGCDCLLYTSPFCRCRNPDSGSIQGSYRQFAQDHAAPS